MAKMLRDDLMEQVTMLRKGPVCGQQIVSFLIAGTAGPYFLGAKVPKRQLGLLILDGARTVVI